MDTQARLAFDMAEDNAQDTELPIDLYFPESEANELARIEAFNKHLYRPNTYLHKWWARRSGTTFRHILKQLVEHPTLRSFYEPGGLEGKVIFDPMMGGGTTLHEAIRMGANVVGVDIDPIPVLQAKASLRHIPLSEKIAIFNVFLDYLRDATVSKYYITHCDSCSAEMEIQFVLYGLMKQCACGERIFVDQLILLERNHKDLRLCPSCMMPISDEAHRCTDAPGVLQTKDARKCDVCKEPYKEYLNIPFSERYRPLVLVAKCQKHGRVFKKLNKTDHSAIEKAKSQAATLWHAEKEHFRVSAGPKSKDLLKRNIQYYIDLFSPRQLIYLDLAVRYLRECPAEHREWLALLVSTSLEFNSMLCGYKGVSLRRPGAIRHVFSHHAYSFPCTALENNPLYLDGVSGTLSRLFQDRIVRAAEWARCPIEAYNGSKDMMRYKIMGEYDGGTEVNSWEELKGGYRKYLVFQGDAGAIKVPDGLVDHVITDPPYFDSVQHSDLSRFFRVWLSVMLPAEYEWDYSTDSSAVSEGDSNQARRYCDALTKIWVNARKSLKPEGRLVFTFHHWRPEAWADLTISLSRAGFALVNCYVVHSENPISVHIRGLRALQHDCILVLRQNASDETEHFSLPSVRSVSDSYSFCKSCGDILGFLLQQQLSEDDIRAKWSKLLSTTKNEKKPS